MREGFFSNFKVTTPPVTIPSFPCIFSGLTVEDLGYCTFIHPSKGVFSSELWKDKSILSINNIRVFSLNLPSTYPAWTINGEMITGLLTPFMNKRMCFPNDLFKTIQKEWIIDGGNVEEVFQAFKIKKDLFIKKAQGDFDLLIYIIRVPDCITHHPTISLNKTLKAIKKGYMEIDKFLGNIFKNVDFDNIFIVSDHGLKIYQYEFNIKRFLEKKNLIHYNNDLISKLLSIFIKFIGYFNIRLFNTTFFHNKVKNFLSRFKILERSSFNKLGTSTNFIHFYSNYGGIKLDGIDKKKKEKMKRILLNNKYVRNLTVYKSNTLPDFIIELHDKYLFSVKSSFFTTNRFNSINHSDKGIIIGYGRNVKKTKLKEFNYLDFAPTILKLYNLDKLMHMKGNIPDIFKNL